jgi:hypothetical protein
MEFSEASSLRIAQPSGLKQALLSAKRVKTADTLAAGLLQHY